MCEISIIIPVYNKEKYINKTVQSVLNQTFTDYEVWLIDDGSTDTSGELCDKLAKKDGRIRVVHTENKGVGAARNLGIRKAGGKYISFIDADDYVHRTFLEKLHNALITKDADMSVCEYYEDFDGKKKYHPYKNFDSGDEVYEVLRQDLLCIIWNKLFVKEKIQHFFDESISTCEDSIFCTRYYYDNIPKISYVNEVLYGYIVNGEGLTSNLQKNAYKGINKYLTSNRKITELICDDKIKKLAIHHVYRNFYYGVYLYIFRNLVSEPYYSENMILMDEIVNDKRYQRIIRFMLVYSLKNIKAERTTIVELLIILFSVFKNKKAVYYITKVRQCPTKIMNLWLA